MNPESLDKAALAPLAQPLLHAEFSGKPGIKPDSIGNDVTLAKAGLLDSHVLLAQLGVPSSTIAYLGGTFKGEGIVRVADKPQSIAAATESRFDGPAYEAERWNKDPKIANCYIYAVNDFNPKYSVQYTAMDPGNFNDTDFSARGGKALQKYANLQIDGAIADGLTWTANNSRPQPGFYKAALFVKPAGNDPNVEDTVDYHWMRQDNSGMWSHKFGEKPVANVDQSQKVIIDPRKADMGKYIFVGYFDVPSGGVNLHRNTNAQYFPAKPVPQNSPMKAPAMPEAPRRK